jgi:hypothetical protein
MAAPVLFKVDVPDSRFGRLEERLLDRSRLSHQTDHQPIVVPIGAVVQEKKSLPLPEGLHDGLDDLTPSALAKVRDTLYELHSHGHLTPPESFGDDSWVVATMKNPNIEYRNSKQSPNSKFKSPEHLPQTISKVNHQKACFCILII